MRQPIPFVADTTMKKNRLTRSQSTLKFRAKNCPWTRGFHYLFCVYVKVVRRMMKIVGCVRLLIVEHSLTQHALQTNNFVVVYHVTIVSRHLIDQQEMFLYLYGTDWTNETFRYRIETFFKISSRYLFMNTPKIIYRASAQFRWFWHAGFGSVTFSADPDPVCNNGYIKIF